MVVAGEPIGDVHELSQVTTHGCREEAWTSAGSLPGNSPQHMCISHHAEPLSQDARQMESPQALPRMMGPIPSPETRDYAVNADGVPADAGGRMPCPSVPARPIVRTSTEYAQMPAADALGALDSGPAGLTPDEARHRLEVYGPNSLRTHVVRPWAVLVRQLRNPLLLLLLAAAAVSGLTGDPTDAVIIGVIVALSRRAGLRERVPIRASRRRAAHANPAPHAAWLRGGAPQGGSTSWISCRATSWQLSGGRHRAGRHEAAPDGRSSNATRRCSPASRCRSTRRPGSAMGRTEQSSALMGTVVFAEGTGGRRRDQSRTGMQTAFGRIAAGLGERPGETAFQVGLRQVLVPARPASRVCSLCRSS